jgi:heptosyltransferase-2
MHLAAMVRIPCVAIFCARDYPGKWEPYGEKHRIIRKDVECAGCMLEVCSYNNRCLQLISVDDIFKELQGLI